MSEASRSTSRWSSSVSTRIKSSSSIMNQPLPSSPQKKLYRLPINNQPSFAQRMAKTRNDVEELFKLYYTNNVKFDTFQRQIVTGTRIPSARASPLIQNNFTNSSTNVFNSKHCVSREQICPLETNDNEHQIVNNESKQLPTKRTVQVRIDNNPTMIQSAMSLSVSPPPPPVVGSMDSNSHVIPPENPSVTRQDEFNESSLVKSLTFLGDTSTDNVEHNNTKKSKSINGQRPISSLTSLPPISPSTLAFINNRKDPSNMSYSSFTTGNSPQQQNQPHIVTGTAVNVCQRSLTKPAWHRQRIKSSMVVSTNSDSQQSNIKASSSSMKCDMPELPVYIGSAQRVVSIPSKCSRYVLVTFPRVPVRYNAPTYVERLLLPERFPTLFQNIVHSCEQNRNNN